MSDDTRCARCGEVAAGYAKINGERYCHPDDPDAPDCYTLTLWGGTPHGMGRGEELRVPRVGRGPVPAARAHRAMPGDHRGEEAMTADDILDPHGLARRTIYSSEALNRLPQTHITFNDTRVEGLLEQWIRDAADLETSNDEARLQFLDPEVLPS